MFFAIIIDDITILFSHYAADISRRRLPPPSRFSPAFTLPPLRHADAMSACAAAAAEFCLPASPLLILRCQLFAHHASQASFITPPYFHSYAACCLFISPPARRQPRTRRRHFFFFRYQFSPCRFII
jgi:hypothetical protein